jgi:hypothetical protein
MKKIVIAGAILLTQVLMATQQPTTKPVQTVDMPTKEMIAQNQKIAKLAAEEMNKTLPQTIDKYTTLVQIAAKGTVLEYLFEINTGAKSDETVQKEDHARMEKAITEGVCHSSKRFLDAKINITYIYRSAVSKAELFRFDISQEKCQQNR